MSDPEQINQSEEEISPVSSDTPIASEHPTEETADEIDVKPDPDPDPDPATPEPEPESTKMLLHRPHPLRSKVEQLKISLTEIYKGNDVRFSMPIEVPVGKNVNFIQVDVIKKDGDNKEQIYPAWGLAQDNGKIHFVFEDFQYLQTVAERKSVREEIEKNQKIENLDKKLFKIAELFEEELNIQGALEVESIEDIEIKYTGVPPMNFALLHDWTLQKQCINYAATFTDAYPEYTWQYALAAASSIVRRRISFEMHGTKYYTNKNLVSLGPTGTAHKTPSFNKMMSLLKKAFGSEYIMNFSPASIQKLVEIMADEQVTRKTHWKTGKVEDIVTRSTYPLKKSQSMLWIDEAESLFSLLRQNYQAGMKNTLNELCGCPDLHEYTSKKDGIIRLLNVYFGMCLTLTESEFIKSLTMSDVKSGFYPRVEGVSPAYEKPRMKHTQKAINDTEVEEVLILKMKIVDALLPKKTLNVPFDNEFMKVYDDWCAERQLGYAKERDEIMGGVFKKHEISILRTAILLDLFMIPDEILTYIQNKIKDNSININVTNEDAEKQTEHYKEVTLIIEKCVEEFFSSKASSSSEINNSTFIRHGDIIHEMTPLLSRSETDSSSRNVPILLYIYI